MVRTFNIGVSPIRVGRLLPCKDSAPTHYSICCLVELHDLNQLYVYGLHAQPVPAEVGQLVVGKPDHIVLSGTYQLLLSQLRVLHVVQVEEHIFTVGVTNQEPIIIIFKEELDGASDLNQVRVDGLTDDGSGDVVEVLLRILLSGYFRDHHLRHSSHV